MSLGNAQARAARALLGLDQKDIMAATGISKVQLSRFESGKSNLSVANIDKLQSFYERHGVQFTSNEGVCKRTGIYIRHLQGDEGLRTLFDDIYQATKQTGQDILIYNGSPDRLIKHLGESFYKEHSKRMTRLQCTVKATVRQGDRNFIGKDFALYKWIAEEEFVDDKTIYVYDHKVAIIDFVSD
ncbi:MAG: helix-turn-helix transcriptional regulator, partial [Pseudomonadota bacterium]